MKILVTGSTGFKGSWLSFWLKTLGAKVIGISFNIPTNPSLFKIIIGNQFIRNYKCDIKNFPKVRNIVLKHKPDFVFHLAAQSYPHTSFDSPSDTLITNANGTSNLLEVLKKSKYDPWIHVCASSEVFGRVPKELIPISEDCPFHPASPYAISKVGTDLIGRFYAEAYDMTVMTTRMFTHTGPRLGFIARLKASPITFGIILEFFTVHVFLVIGVNSDC